MFNFNINVITMLFITSGRVNKGSQLSTNNVIILNSCSYPRCSAFTLYNCLNVLNQCLPTGII